jgi:hypothetical protein
MSLDGPDVVAVKVLQMASALASLTVAVIAVLLIYRAGGWAHLFK